jgi:hypothetical protein
VVTDFRRYRILHVICQISIDLTRIEPYCAHQQKHRLATNETLDTALGCPFLGKLPAPWAAPEGHQHWKLLRTKDLEMSLSGR